MRAEAFLDTNVLIYAFAKDDPRAEVAERLLEAGGAVSVQVLNEFVAVARRKLQMPWSEVVDALAAIRLLCGAPLPLTAEDHDAAIEIAQQHGYTIYDAMIVATAMQAGCRTLYSEDMQDGRRFDLRIEIKNPFAAEGQSR
ncbi:MAG TPA: PIN domain-containing protein [Caulobacteraceae bacterium]|nr:PIN domain-containing protein [Caulobacteraceae bacterium]